MKADVDIEESGATEVQYLNLHRMIKNNSSVEIDCGLCGAENMARDEANAQHLLRTGGHKVLIRLYSWSPWCVSLGANQKESDVDIELMRSKGFELVRRSTGGRAVLHARELTYSIAMRIPSVSTIHEIYRVSHEIIRDGLQRLGAHDVQFKKSQPDFAQRYRTNGDSVSCFTSAARSEVMWNSRKVVGSAQRVFGSVLLQHGSVLLGQGHEELADVVRLDSDDQRLRLRDALLSQSVSLSEVCNRQIAFDECADAFHHVFSSI